MIGTGPADVVAGHMAASHRAGVRCSIAWLNHYSVQRVMRRSASVHAMHAFDLVGIDGILLKRFARSQFRTSADLVLPRFFARADAARTVLIGGHPERTPRLADALQSCMSPGGRLVGAMDGYAGLLRGHELERWIETLCPTVVIIGLGSPLQEEVAADVAAYTDVPIIATCGGFVDQLLHQGGYYPSWAYPFRLNWAVRLAREPTRLWPRYSVEAMAATRQRRDLRAFMHDLRGYKALQEMLNVACAA